MRIGIITLGCDKNTVDNEHLAGLLAEAGCEIVTGEALETGELDAVVVTTCGFIADAKLQSIEKIAELADAKRDFGSPKRIYVMGCLSQRYPEALLQEAPEIDGVTGVGQMETLVKAILRGGGKANMVHPKPTTRRARALPRVRLEEGPHAYLKIADGCNHACTFCAIPRMKGRLQSVAPDLLLDEAQTLLKSGVREINLIAQDISEYGRDLRKGYDLPRLLRDLNALDGDFWIRCLYCYPGGVTDELLQAMSDCAKVVRYLDVPLQHFDPKVLDAMRRPNATMDADRLVARLRDAMPDIVLRTTLIVGFPGETPQAHDRMLDAMRRLQFDRLGAFEYSAEEDTPAASMPRQVGKGVKQARWEAVMELQAEIAEERNRLRIGRSEKLLVTQIDKKKGLYHARSHGEAPEIDGIVHLKSQKNLCPGDFVFGKIKRADSYDFQAIEGTC